MLTEYEQCLVKEVLAEAKKAKEISDRSFERLEKLCEIILEKKDAKTGQPDPS